MNDTNLKGLKACFQAFSSLIIKDKSIPEPEAHSLDDYTRIFSNFADLHRKPGQLVSNIFELCGLNRDEVRNCRVLAWWLDKSADHGLGRRFLEKMFVTANKPVEKSLTKYDTDSNYSTRTEICPNGDNSDRVDIVCESAKLLVYIEVKIDSTEHSSQTQRYYNRLLHNAGDRQFALFFISPNTPPTNDKARFISWKQIGEIAKDLANEAQSNYVKQLLDQYSNFIRNF